MREIATKFRDFKTEFKNQFAPSGSFQGRLKAAYEKNHGKGSFWFSKGAQRATGESDEAYISRRYAENLTGIYAADDARSAGEAFIANNQWSVFRLGLAMGAAMTLILSYGEINSLFGNILVLVTMFATLIFGTKWNPNSLLEVLTRTGVQAPHLKRAAQSLSETLIRVNASDAPADLRDLYRLPFIDTNGKPLSERIIETDITEDYYQDQVHSTSERVKATLLWFLFFGIFSGLLAMLLGAGLMGMSGASPSGDVAGMFSGQAAGKAFSYENLSAALGVDLTYLLSVFGISGFALIALGSAMVFKLSSSGRSSLDRRMENIEAISEKSIDQLADQSGITATLLQTEKALEDQIANAKNDNTPFFQLGSSTGYLRSRYDAFAPSHAGMPFGLTFQDLATHLIVLGGTGSGKTSGTIRPLVTQWLDNGSAGMLVLDGKGMLPYELSGRTDYTLISPETTTLNPIEGLSPDDVAETLSNLGSEDGGSNSDPYWNNAAAKLVRSAAHVAWVLADIGKGVYNLSTIYEIASSESAQEKARHAIDQAGGISSYSGATARGVKYALAEFPRMPEKQRGSIEGIASLWLSQITDNEKMSSWADAVQGYEIEKVTQGERVGVLLPEATYGKAGVLVAGLLKKRVYEAIKRRGDQWTKDPTQTPVLEVIDEVQELLTDDEVNMLPVARSLGLYAVFSTQNVDGILNKLGDHAGYQLLGNLRSMVAYQTQTEKTTAYISERMGSSFRPTIQQAERYEDLGSRLRKTSRFSDSENAYQPPGIGRTLKTAGVRIAELGTGTLDFLKHPETRYREIETSSPGTERIRDSIKNNKNLSGAENFEKWGLVGQSLTLNRNIDNNEVNEALSQPNTALAQVIRGRVVRRDLIESTPIYDLEASR